MRRSLDRTSADWGSEKFLLTVPAGPQRDLLLQRTAEALANLKRFSPTYSKHLMSSACGLSFRI